MAQFRDEHERALAEATFEEFARAVLAFAAREGVALSEQQIDDLARRFVVHFFRNVLPDNDLAGKAIKRGAKNLSGKRRDYPLLAGANLAPPLTQLVYQVVYQSGSCVKKSIVINGLERYLSAGPRSPTGVQLFCKGEDV